MPRAGSTWATPPSVCFTVALMALYVFYSCDAGRPVRNVRWGPNAARTLDCNGDVHILFYRIHVILVLRLRHTIYTHNLLNSHVLLLTPTYLNSTASKLTLLAIYFRRLRSASNIQLQSQAGNLKCDISNCRLDWYQGSSLHSV